MYFIIQGICGAKDPPKCANYAVRRTAVDNEDCYLEPAYAVLNHFYMDNYLGFVKNPFVLTLSRSLVELLKLGVFNLAKFINNIPNLSLKLNLPKTSDNNIKEVLTAAINPETTSHVLVTDKLVVRRGVNRELKDSVTQPSVLNYALRRTAVDNQDCYPEAAYAVLEIFYMDDYFGSVKNPETSLRLSRSLVELPELGVSNLAKFFSNIPKLSLKLNPPKTRASNSK